MPNQSQVDELGTPRLLVSANKEQQVLRFGAGTPSTEKPERGAKAIFMT